MSDNRILQPSENVEVAGVPICLSAALACLGGLATFR